MRSEDIKRADNHDAPKTHQTPNTYHLYITQTFFFGLVPPTTSTPVVRSIPLLLRNNPANTPSWLFYIPLPSWDEMYMDVKDGLPC